MVRKVCVVEKFEKLLRHSGHDNNREEIVPRNLSNSLKRLQCTNLSHLDPNLGVLRLRTRVPENFGTRFL